MFTIAHAIVERGDLQMTVRVNASQFRLDASVNSVVLARLSNEVNDGAPIGCTSKYNRTYNRHNR